MRVHRSENHPIGRTFGRLLAVLVLFGAVAYMASGFTVIRPGEVGVHLRFGAIVNGHLEPGLHYALPWPVERIVRVNANRVYRVELGFRTDPAIIRNVSSMLWETRHYKIEGYDKMDAESITLSGDEYVLDFSIVVHYRPLDAVVHRFRVHQIQEVVRGLAEACMREILAAEDSGRLMTDHRSNVLKGIEHKINDRLHYLGLGVEVVGVHCHDVHPPMLTLAKFRDVFSAREDRVKYIRESEAQRNEALPKARAESTAMLTDAEALRIEKGLKARGDAEKFLLTARAYQKAPEVTGYRLFLESVERSLTGRDKFIANPEANVGGYQLWMFTPRASQRSTPGGL